MRAHNRVRETCSTTGTGNLSCDGAVTGYKAFVDRYANGEEFPYTCAGGAEWETGRGRYKSSTDEVERLECYESSASDAFVNFTVASKFLWVDHPAEDDNSTGETLAIARGEFMP